MNQATVEAGRVFSGGSTGSGFLTRTRRTTRSWFPDRMLAGQRRTILRPAVYLSMLQEELNLAVKVASAAAPRMVS